MKLEQLIKDLSYNLVSGTLDKEITNVSYDSRKATKDGLFVAIEGVKSDGHDYIDQVIEQGAAAVVVTKDMLVKEGVTYIKVDNSRKALALISAEFFGHPSKDLTVIGLTGTKGKTTTSLMVKAILDVSHKKVGIIGTNGTFINGIHEPTSNTTPISYELQRIMRKMVDEGCRFCVMEVSSQALKQDRVTGIDFDYGIFTNISPDHIGENEHKDFNEYMSCKQMLFKMCKIGIFNRDDEHYEDFVKEADCEIHTFAVDHEADIVAKDIKLYREGKHMGFTFNSVGMVNDHFKVDIPGTVNVYNALVAIMIASMNGIDMEPVKRAFEKIQILGRGQIMDINDDYTVIIDYAHNGASFDSIISAVEAYAPKRIVCVYGCGGRRSHERRYECGHEAAKHHVVSILTMDNPRGEKVLDICNDIISVLEPEGGVYTVIEDRRDAIYYALDHAKKGDVILLLGKGHETYQIGEDNITRHFSETEILEEYKRTH